MNDEELHSNVFFNPISFDDCVQMLLKRNPNLEEENIKEALKRFISLKKDGVRCFCGNRIWVIGSALTYVPMCFTCITGKPYLLTTMKSMKFVFSKHITYGRNNMNTSSERLRMNIVLPF